MLEQYYDANKLLLDCLNSDCTVTPSVRSTLLVELLLPPCLTILSSANEKRSIVEQLIVEDRLTAVTRQPGKAVTDFIVPYDGNNLLFETTINRSTLQVQVCDITSLRVDAIVSSDNTKLSMEGGVSNAIRLAGGSIVRHEAKAQAPLKLGGIAITTAGQLPARQIFHAAVMDFTQPPSAMSDVIQQVTQKCLIACDRMALHSIAFPALATGAAAVSPDRSAHAMMTAITAHLSSTTQIEQVVLALYMHPTLANDLVVSRFATQVTEFLQQFQ